MAFNIQGKIALVTGGANGIGLAYVKELLTEGAAGITIADIAPNGDDVAKSLNATFGSGKVIFVKTDVTDDDQLEGAFKATIKAFRGLDIVINNAGIMNDAKWKLEVAINVSHVVQGSLLAIKYIGKNNGGKGGVVVNIASILGLQKLTGCPIYVGTKHFVVGLTQSFGTPFYADLTGIRFMTMCPGVTDTPLISDAGKFALSGVGNVAQELVNGLGALPPQPTQNVAKGLITMLKGGANGSVWVSEGNAPIYEVDIPDRLTLRKK